jgi:hypothetical protein
MDEHVMLPENELSASDNAQEGGPALIEPVMNFPTSGGGAGEAGFALAGFGDLDATCAFALKHMGTQRARKAVDFWFLEIAESSN